MLVLDHLMPVFLLIALGAVLRRTGFTNEAFLAASDRLIYYVFFPALLFWKIGGAPAEPALPLVLWAGGVLPLVVVFVLSLLCIALAGIGRRQAGAFSQATYRFNTYVAIAVVGSVLGDEGVRRLGELLGLAIPVANLLAVGTLVWFSPRMPDRATRTHLAMKAVVTNPLILACVAGMVWARGMPPLPVPVDRTLALASAVTLPLSLISIGGSLTVRAVRGHLGLASLATGLKCMLLPAVGYVILQGLGAPRTEMLVAMLFLAMPASTAMYVLSRQLDSDATLSSASIVVSTAFSFLTLSAVLLLFG